MKRICSIWIAAAFILVGVNAQAQENDWNWSLTPYAWLAGMDGDLTARGLTVPVDQSFSDLVDDLSFAAMLMADGNNGTWGVMADAVYVGLDDSQETGAGQLKGEVHEWILSAVAYLTVSSNEKMTLDVGAGGRYTDMTLDVSVPTMSVSASQNWVDPILLARVRLPLSDKFNAAVTGDVGGFGVGADLTWQVVASAGYAITKSIDAVIGYRYLAVDFEDGDFAYDIATSGFGLGLKFAL